MGTGGTAQQVSNAKAMGLGKGTLIGWAGLV